MAIARWLLALSAVWLALGVYGLTPRGVDAAGSQLQIASFQPFTGADASFGPEMIAGCQPAAWLINHNGGVLGHTIKCTAVDTRGDPADAVPAAQQLLATSSDLLGVMGPSSDEALATLPLFQRARMTTFPDSGQAALDRSTNPYMWRILPADDVKGYAMAVWAHEQGYTRGATIFGNDIGSQGVVPTLTRGFSKLGGKIVVDEKLVLDQSSYRTEIERMLAAKPQVIFSELDPQSSATFLAELEQLHGLTIPVVFTELALESDWYHAVSRAIGKPAVARIVTGVQFYTPSSGLAWQTFYNAMKPAGQNFNTWGNDPYILSYYDSVNLMCLAALAAKSTDPAVYNPYIATITTPAPGAVSVYTFAQGKKALQQGKRIRYIGAVGSIQFNEFHNAVGTFAASHHTASGPIVLSRVLPSSLILKLMH